MHEKEHERTRRADPDLTGRVDRPTPPKIRRRVLRRDRHCCQVCGAKAYIGHPLEVHHVNGVRADNRLENLVTLCADCHRRADRALGIRR